MNECRERLIEVIPMCYEVLKQYTSNTSVDVFDVYWFIVLMYGKIMSSQLNGKADFELCNLFVDLQTRLEVVFKCDKKRYCNMKVSRSNFPNIPECSLSRTAFNIQEIRTGHRSVASCYCTTCLLCHHFIIRIL